MAVEWTKDQEKVIKLRNRNLLVSAAAGSGKTAVLVERIIARLTKDEPPIDVDELLVVTFTEAAAAEMKERIGQALENALEADPENAHLKKQAALIHTAKIMTIHSFCLSVIREYFHTIDLDPGFRIAEEGELKLLKRDVVQELLEVKYQEADSGFLSFVDSFATGKDDENLEMMILELHEFAGSFPNPEEWLDKCTEQYRDGLDENAEFMKKIVWYIKNILEDVKMEMERAKEIALLPDGPYVYEKTIEEDKEFLSGIFEANTFREFYEAFQNLGTTWPRLASNRDKSVDLDKKEMVQKIRKKWQALINDIREDYFSQSIEEMDADMRRCYPVVCEYVKLVKEFGKAFSKKKEEKNMIDFHDMEQFALQILSQEDVAKDYQRQFKEIMVDEYQDSNFLQETILTSVSRIKNGEYNMFMVGDVKQSIYRFRLSRPELFMEKYDNYSSEESQCQKIDLHENFRSREEVLHPVNVIFEQLMKKQVGGIDYDEKAALHVGAKYEESLDNTAELILVHTKNILDEKLKSEEAREMEVRAIAKRIHELMEEQMVEDKKTKQMRPIRYSDIVILSRSLNGYAEHINKIFPEEGIPVLAESKEGYFKTLEISWLLQYLRVLDNYRQDIPLTSVLKSPFGNCTNEELSQIRGAWKHVPFHEAVLRVAGLWWQEEVESGAELDAALVGKIRHIFTTLEKFREEVAYTSIHELLWNIVKETGYRDYISAMPGGEQREANLDMLLIKAKAYENTSYKGLFHFIRFMDQMEKYEMDMGEVSLSDEQMNAVRLMSIHKSKGLEFPVVIVAGLGKSFNTQDIKKGILMHPDLGLGMDVIDFERRTKATTILKQVIKKELQIENMGEELRVLYVALTRAKEKLIMTGTCADPGKDWGKEVLSFSRIISAGCYLDWLLPATASLNGDWLDVWTRSVEELTLEDEFHGKWTHADKEIFLARAAQESIDECFYRRLEEQFTYQYPFDSEQVKMKFSVSELKKRAAFPEEREESGETLWTEEDAFVPAFLEKEEKLVGAARGSAYHKVMELLDFSKEYDEENLELQMKSWVKTGYLSEEMRQCVNQKDVLEFLASSAGQRMQRAAKEGRLFKEQPFVFGVNAKEMYPDSESEDLVLIQGIIDVYFEEDGDLVVLDYKTDQVRWAEELVERYQEQLELYSRALCQIREKWVKEKIIYSFTLKREISLK